MGSKKKKAEKKKDFQKTKLKVGKTTAKPDNYTDTSFTARSISLPNQSIAKKVDAHLTGQVDLTHHLLLTKHHSAATRKEVLNYIENHLPSSPSLYKQILTLTVSLVTDQSASVRRAFISLLAACADKQPGLLELHMRSIILFVHSAMSHIQGDIRSTSTGVLEVLVDKAPAALVKGYYVKTLRQFFTLMSWTLTDDKSAVSLAVNTTSSLDGSSKKARVGHLTFLTKFLEAALFEQPVKESSTSIDWSNCVTTHPQTPRYMLPANSLAFAPLKLYITELPSNMLAAQAANSSVDGAYSLYDLEKVSSEDQDTRRKITYDVFLKPLKKNLTSIMKEGGEAGKEANTCIAVVDRFEKDYTKASTL
ncbi:CIC11C00000004522 [Sungouiella intermedia]|uniref:Pre-rRNA-processing protein n=1 Tax=Sungouiella intermedia TaxID=45354 RepID=A0A1L0C0R6_9ASCO|nr:CIC11C00000004522 [[Candida] intermedia]